MSRFASVFLAAALASIPVLAPADQMDHGMTGMHEGGMMSMPNGGMTKGGMTLGALPASLQGKPVVVRIHADWCPACKATRATYDRVVQTYAGKATFVTFDVTDAKTSASAEAKAKELGLSKIFEADKTKTSTVAVIDPKTGSIVASLYNDNEAADYAQAIDRARKKIKKSS